MAPGGTSLPLMVLLCTKLSYPNTKAECEKPGPQQPVTSVSHSRAVKLHANQSLPQLLTEPAARALYNHSGARKMHKLA